MDGSPLFKVVEDKSDSHKGVFDCASSSLSSQCGELNFMGQGTGQGKPTHFGNEGKRAANEKTER